MPLDVGSRLGHYDVTAKIGEGGMGEVYRARDTTLDRDVAIKVLPDAFASDAERLARFEREAKVLASLNHPNIGAIYGLEKSGDTRALVLELVEGPTLADRIKQGPIPLDEALPIATQIADALEAAHEQGVIHRDLKPANVKVKDDGTVKVLDFGLAKAFQPNASDVSASMSPTISLTAAATQMGMVIGTAAYMAPEQAKGKVVDKRADVWAFGVVLYEMLTGDRPFKADDVSLTLARVLDREPEWDALDADLPPAMLVFIKRCLEKDPRERIRDIGDVRLALAGAFDLPAAPPVEVPEPTEIVVAPQLQVWQRPIPLVLVGLALIAVTGFAVWSLIRPGPQAVARFEIPFRAEETFTGLGRHAVAVSPDGLQIVYTTTAGLALRSLDQVTPVLVAGTDEGAREPFFSPDGQSIGFYTQSSNQLQKVFTSGGAPVTLGDAQNPWGASWGADDMILYGQGSEGIWRVPGTGGTPELVIMVEEGEQAHGPQMLPDGWVLFTVRPAAGSLWDAAQIVMQSLATGERVVLINGGRDARYVETGHLVYAVNGVVTAIAFDLDAREVLGGPVPLVEGVRYVAGPTGAVQFSVAGNGSLVYIPGGAGAEGLTLSLAWVTRTGEDTPMAAPVRNYGDPRVSPDGTRVAVAVLADNIDVWIWHLDDGPLTRLTFDEGLDAFPLWTPDSSRVVFRSTRDGRGLFWRAADGTGAVERLLESANDPLPWGWSTDGRLVFQELGDIGVLTVEGDRTVEMLLETEFEEEVPALSPDGRWIAYQSNESGRSEIYVQPFPNVDDGKWQVSTNLGVDPVWSPDGRHLFFVTLPPRMMVAEVETEPTFSPGTPTEAFDLSAYSMGGGGRRYDLAPDGERFILRRAGGPQTADGDSFNGLIFVEHWFEELTARVPVP